MERHLSWRSEMGNRHFVAVHTECGCIVGCNHKHKNVTTATACVSHPGGYVVAVRRRKYLQLTDTEEAEFQRAMYGSGVAPRHDSGEPGMVLNPETGN